MMSPVRSCQEVSRLVSESRDRDMSLGERIGIRFHLAMCRACGAFSKQVVTLGEASTQLEQRLEAGKGPGPDLPADVRKRIAEAIRDA